MRDRENESFSNDWEDHLPSWRMQGSAAWSQQAHPASVGKRRTPDGVFARKQKGERTSSLCEADSEDNLSVKQKHTLEVYQ